MTPVEMDSWVAELRAKLVSGERRVERVVPAGAERVGPAALTPWVPVDISSEVVLLLQRYEEMRSGAADHAAAERIAALEEARTVAKPHSSTVYERLAEYVDSYRISALREEAIGLRQEAGRAWDQDERYRSQAAHARAATIEARVAAAYPHEDRRKRNGL